jgi:hypothetical protein
MYETEHHLDKHRKLRHPQSTSNKLANSAPAVVDAPKQTPDERLMSLRQQMDERVRVLSNNRGRSGTAPANQPAAAWCVVCVCVRACRQRGCVCVQGWYNTHARCRAYESSAL